MQKRNSNVDEYLSEILAGGSRFPLVPRNNSFLETISGKDMTPVFHIENRLTLNRVEKVFDGCTFINCNFYF